MRENWQRSSEVQRPWCRRKIRKRHKGKKMLWKKILQKKKSYSVDAWDLADVIGGAAALVETAVPLEPPVPLCDIRVTWLIHICDMSHSKKIMYYIRRRREVAAAEAVGPILCTYLYSWMFKKKSDIKNTRAFVRTECMYIYVHIHIDGKKEKRGKLCMYIRIYMNIYFTYI